MNTALHELYTTKYWNIQRESVPAFIKAINENIASHMVFEHKGMPGMFLSRSHQFEPMDTTYVTSNPRTDIEDPYYGYIKDDDEFINLVKVNGGITRNAACGYGSRAQRDQVLYAAKRKNCIGHIFLIDTPGGSAYSIEDYAEAIEAARTAGQPVIACIDGLCASAGYGLACQCDAIYYTSPNNIVGCIGTMAIYVTNANGDKNTITQEVYHEEYDPESYDKNIEMRKASEGDNSLIQEELKVHGQYFRDLVTKCRPNVKDEQLHGLTFKASEVEGTLVDGRKTLQDCIDLLASKTFVAPVPSASSEDPASSEEPDDKCNPKRKCETSQPLNESTAAGLSTLQPSEALSTAEGISTQQPPNDMDPNIQTALIEAQASIADLNSQIEALNATIAERDEQATVLNNSVAERESTIADLNSQIEALNATIAERDEQATVLNNSVAEHEATIADLNSTIAERDATIAELSAEAPADTNPAPATAEGKQTDGDKNTPTSACASNDNMSVAERREAQKERDRILGL